MPHWQRKQRPQGVGDTGSSGGGESGKMTMTAMTGNKDYNVGQALHCGRIDDGRGRQQSTKSSSRSGIHGSRGGGRSRAAVAVVAVVAEAWWWWWWRQ